MRCSARTFVASKDSLTACSCVANAAPVETTLRPGAPVPGLTVSMHCFRFLPAASGIPRASARRMKREAGAYWSSRQTRRCPRNGKRDKANLNATAFLRGKAICPADKATRESGDRSEAVHWALRRAVLRPTDSHSCFRSPLYLRVGPDAVNYRAGERGGGES